MTDGFYIPDGNEALRDDIPAVVDDRANRAVGQSGDISALAGVGATPLADDRSTMRDGPVAIPTPERTGLTAEVQQRRRAAGVGGRPRRGVTKPKNWTVCHIWGYDDPSFAQQSRRRARSALLLVRRQHGVLPTPLKGALEIKAMLGSAPSISMDGLVSILGRRAGQRTSGWIP